VTLSKEALNQVGETEQEILEIPVLPRRDTVLFPRMGAQLIVMRESSLQAIDETMSQDRSILVVARKNVREMEMTSQDLYPIGTQASVSRVLKLPDGTSSLWVQGERRMRILEVVQMEPFIKVRAVPLQESKPSLETAELHMRAILALFEKFVHLSPNLPEGIYTAASNADDPGWLADLIVSSLELDVPTRQEVLELLDPVGRLQRVSILLAKELDVLEVQNKIHAQVQNEVDKSHKEFYLREQLRAIQKELGETDPLLRDVNELREKMEKQAMPEEVKKRAEEELARLSSIPPASPETSVIRTYLDWLVNLPWSQETVDNLDIKAAAKVQEANHYGLPKVKERILEYIAVRKLSHNRLRSPILCFVGPPGVGKTSLGKSIAQAMGRKFVRISLGGIRDEAEIRGHRRTYVGALPGRILQTMRTAGTINPVFMLDEVDKVGTDFRGDPSSALLEVLDPEQNHSFSDHYLEVPYNLSKVLFIATANILDTVIPALRDRMEVIELPGYTEEEKLQIALRFLVPKQLQEHGLDAGQIKFTPGTLRHMIREYTREAGVRNLEREIGTICRKVAKLAAEGEAIPRYINTSSVEKYLGPEKYFWGSAEERDEVGVATGVARTEMGGDVMGVEVTIMEGKGKLILTGQLGDVMKESAQAALSYARSHAHSLHINGDSLEKSDVHIHVPAGAVPKDGPSAGITMATALISALSHQPVRRDVAMTGEITLRGRVLPVGGVKEKVLAAHRAGIKTFILPKKNEKDILDVPAKVRKDIRFVPVDVMEKVLAVGLINHSGLAKS